jgi:protein PET100
MYLAFPIGYMYYFGTNLENRFSVPGFWPTQEQSHKIPFEREEIRAEVQRIQQKMADLRTRLPVEQQQRLKDRGTEVPEQNTSG